MRRFLYLRLALQGIGKNKKIYFPYLLASSGCAMMSYIILALASDRDLANIRGGTTAQQSLGMGAFVILLFSLIFLLYTSSFLMKQRRREFGLLNILGMNKWNLCRVMLWESLLSYAVTVVLGISLGVLFTKLCILLLFQMLGQIPILNFTVSISALESVVGSYAAIFLLLLVKNLLQVRLSKPIDLLHSVNTGEKQPKANYLLAILGLALLGGGYYIALTVKSTVTAFEFFFNAVLLVILGTYLCFISASVAILKLLKKSKGYYYRSNHFISLSNMIFRMRRNGAGLASICIILTMILVMLSSTLCLRLGCEDSLKARYPEQFYIEQFLPEGDTSEESPQETVENFLDSQGLSAAKLVSYPFDSTYMQKSGNQLCLSLGAAASTDAPVLRTSVLSLASFNAMCGQGEALEPDQVLLVGNKRQFPEGTLELDGFAQYRIKTVLPSSYFRGIDALSVTNSCYLVLPTQEDVDAFRAAMEEQYGTNPNFYYPRTRICSFDLGLDDAGQQQLFHQMTEDPSFEYLTVSCQAAERADFLALYGGLLFLGLLLGFTFLMGAVLIIYYKQVSEGYEDAGRFRILMDVGMTDREIQKSINSQILTVFFLPLLVAALHTGFALPIISLILTGFGFHNTGLYYLISGGVFLVMCLLYTGVYSATSRTYYNIVKSGTK